MSPCVIYNLHNSDAINDAGIGFAITMEPLMFGSSFAFKALAFSIGEYMSFISYKKIDGSTGDAYGAIIELGDAISLLSFWSVIIWI